MTNEEAIKILKSKMDGSVDTSYEWAETVRMAIKALEQPTIEPRCEECEAFNKTRLLIPQPQRTGRWIEQDDSWDGVYYECSACGEPWTLIDGTPWDNGMKFCPNCGADMREPEDIPMEYFESGGR